MKRFVLLALFSCLTSFACFADVGVVYVDDEIRTTVNRYKSVDNKQTIHVVGLTHYGPENYYDKLHAYLESIQSKDVVFLEEFATCDGAIETYEIDRCDVQPISDLFSEIAFPVTVNSLLSLDDGVFNRMRQKQFLKKGQCTIDPVSGDFRPDSIMRRNLKRCESAASFGLSCQHDINFLKPNFIKTPSDIRLTEKDVGLQFLTSLMYLTNSTPNCSYSSFINSILKEYDDVSFPLMLTDFVTKHRDQILFQKLDSVLKTSNEIVVFWGATHSKKIGEHLKQFGFKLVDTEYIKYMHRSEAGQWPGFDDMVRQINWEY